MFIKNGDGQVLEVVKPQSEEENKKTAEKFEKMKEDLEKRTERDENGVQ